MARHTLIDHVLLSGQDTFNKKWTNDSPTPYSTPHHTTPHHYLLLILHLGRIYQIGIGGTPQSPVLRVDLIVHIKLCLVSEQNCKVWVLYPAECPLSELCVMIRIILVMVLKHLQYVRMSFCFMQNSNNVSLADDVFMGQMSHVIYWILRDSSKNCS